MYGGESDDDPLMPQVFAVEDPTEAGGAGGGGDPDAPPTTGHEYLRRVMQEARSVPAVVVADIDAELLQSTNPIAVPLCSRLHPAPCGYAPSLTWQQERVSEFSQLRLSFARYKARLKRDKVPRSRLIPLKDDGESWCRLCFGRLNVRRQWRACNERGLQFKTEGGTGPGGAERRNLHGAGEEGTPPLLSIVAFIDQATVSQVLKYHYDWLTVTGFTMEQGRWFYALFACLEKPLEPDVCSLLRDLARACASLRAALESAEDPRLPALNLIICLVARYFSQMDLADPG